MFKIKYKCPSCGNAWEEYWESACDDECGDCGATDIEPVSFEDVIDINKVRD